MARILIVDDDEAILEMMETALTLEGHEVFAAADGRAALDRYGEARPDLVITDLIMPEQEGIETIRKLRRADPDLPIIAMSGHTHHPTEVFLAAAERLGADVTLPKPFGAQQLVETVAALLEKPKG